MYFIINLCGVLFLVKLILKFNITSDKIIFDLGKQRYCTTTSKNTPYTHEKATNKSWVHKPKTVAI